MLYAYILAGADAGAGGGIYSYEVKDGGRLEPASYIALPCPMYAVISDGGIYVVCRHAVGGTDRFGRAADSAVTRVPLGPEGSFGEPSPFWPTEGVTGCHVDYMDTADGKILFTANYSSALISRLAPEKDGYACAAAVIHGAPDGTHGRFDSRAYLHQSLVCDGCVFAVDLGRDEVDVYDPDLNFVSSCSLAKGTGPRHIIFRGEDGWTVNELTSTVCRFKWDRIARRLTYIETYDLLPDGSSDEYRLACAGAAIRISGDTLYACVRLDNSVTAFDIMPDGALAKKQYIKCGGDWPRDINLTPDGKYLYSANEREGSVTVFSAGDGGLSFIGDTARLPLPNNILFAEN